MDVVVPLVLVLLLGGRRRSRGRTRGRQRARPARDPTTDRIRNRIFKSSSSSLVGELFPGTVAHALFLLLLRLHIIQRGAPSSQS